ncbi:MAG: Stk1 family PASTA domain-containing Ser/Thr kinase [Lachnospiraceae bacterium]|nr:Stk1 family PASTA domain-containing Ser/Thr kinase [Lachnospiraceae bacterium]
MIVPGTMLGGRYEVIELIGTGGMANVYKAIDRKLNREVAIKVLKEEYSSNKNFVSKFKAEAQAAAGLMHPNIVNVYDVGDENGLYYFVMELVDGITLKNYIEKKIRLSVKEAVSIAIQVSMGIEAAHNKGIIHRDIKPQNIIISRDGKVKVADFGIARAATSDTITTHAMGSVHYTSPEQARGGYSDAKSDIYSIGITLFEMVTGRVPFDGETTVSIAIKHIQEEMPSPRMYVAEMPVSVEQIIFKCTQKNPDRRYMNITELINDLKRSLINPDENFVVIQDAASNAGTRTITEKDRQEIMRSTKDPMQESYRDQMYQNQAYSGRPAPNPYQGEIPGMQDQYPMRQRNDAHPQEQPMNDRRPRYNGPQANQAPNLYPGEIPAQQMPNPYMADPQYVQMQGPYPPDPAQQMQNPYPVDPAMQHNNQQQYVKPQQQMRPQIELPTVEELEDDGDEEMIDFLFTPKLVNQKRTEEVKPDTEEESSRKNTRTRNKKKSKAQEKKERKEQERAEKEERLRTEREARELEKAERELERDERKRLKQKNKEETYMETRDEGDVDPKMEGIMSFLLIVAAVVIALVAVFVVGRAMGLFSATPLSKIAEGMVETPSVVGLSLDEASAVLKKAGLTAKASYKESTVYEKDYISEQSPAAGEAIEEGGVLDLVVSSGKVAAAEGEGEGDNESDIKMIEVPNVVGLLKAEARVSLENEEFKVLEEEVDDPTADMNSVVRQSPESLATAPLGSEVTIYICTGRPVKEVVVPDLNGKTLEEAKVILDETGLTYANVNEEPNDTVAKGIVIAQGVPAGTTVNEGDNVDLKVSSGPITYSCNFNIQAPADYLAGTEAIIVLVNAAGVELGRFSTVVFPYNLVQSGITGSDSGAVTVTYINLAAEYTTTAPVAVTFNRE